MSGAGIGTPCATRLTCGVLRAGNIVLLLVKLYAFLASRSFAVLASLADSGVDLASQIVLWFCNRCVLLRQAYSLPGCEHDGWFGLRITLCPTSLLCRDIVVKRARAVRRKCDQRTAQHVMQRISVNKLRLFVDLLIVA